MNERPILFKAPMVRALIEGRKTQTIRINFKCEVGDRLWVKETWSVNSLFDELKPSEIDKRAIGGIAYLADGKRRHGKIRSSLFMPKWASRIWLEVTKVNEKYLHDINKEDVNPWVRVISLKVLDVRR